MKRTLVRTGNSTALILTRDMKAHLGVTDAVDVQFEEGKIVLRKPEAEPHGMDFEEAKSRSHERYAESYKELAK